MVIKVKKVLKSVISLVCFLVLLFFCTHLVSDALMRKDSLVKYNDIQKDEFDVLFFGTSHMINGIFPMELWEDYGIVSYNCAGHANTLPATYWMLRNVLEEKEKPELVVIDIYSAGRNNVQVEERSHIEYQHYSYDWKNISLEKIRMSNALFGEFETRIEFLFPIAIYHERWKDLTRDDFEIPYNTEKGAEYRVNRVTQDEFTLIPREQMKEEESAGKEYLCKMIEECQAMGIEVLLTHIPYPGTTELQEWGNSVELIAEQYNINYLNFFYEDTGVNLQTDYYDESYHLNPSGARKLTEYIGNYIQKEYQIPDRREDSQYQHWHEDYREYTDFKWETLQNAKGDVGTYLSLLNDDHLSFCLYLAGDSDFDDEDIGVLLDNIYEGTSVKIGKNSEQDYCMVLDRNSGNIQESKDGEAICCTTVFGEIEYSDNNAKSLKINGEETNYLLNEDGTQAEMSILVFDKETNEMVDFARFNTEVIVSGT